MRRRKQHRWHPRDSAELARAVQQRRPQRYRVRSLERTPARLRSPLEQPLGLRRALRGQRTAYPEQGRARSSRPWSEVDSGVDLGIGLDSAKFCGTGNRRTAARQVDSTSILRHGPPSHSSLTPASRRSRTACGRTDVIEPVSARTCRNRPGTQRLDQGQRSRRSRQRRGSKTSRFSRSRSALAVFGTAASPSSRCQRKTICAPVLPWWGLAIATIAGSVRRSPPLPIGAHVSATMPLVRRTRRRRLERAMGSTGSDSRPAPLRSRSMSGRCAPA